jgi:predicted  nucleic acid-binding Zn-ribbon protein
MTGAVVDQLHRLQDRLRFVEARRKQRDTVPPELTEVDREFREKVDTVSKLKARLAEAEVERRRAEAERTDLSERQRRYKEQMRQVQSSREYSALLNEIDAVEKHLRSAEDRALSLEEELENARTELSEREARLPTETAEHEERMKDWRSAQKLINEELAAAEIEISRLENEIPPRERSEFRRLLEKKHGLAVVQVVNGSCSACHVKVRPAAMQILKAGREIVYCDTCKRILYWEPQSS